MPTKKETWNEIDQYRNTNVFEKNGIRKVRLYETIIFQYDPTNGEVKLSTGGHKTDTTKRRINECLNALGFRGKLYQENHAWYVWHDSRRGGRTDWWKSPHVFDYSFTVSN